MAARSADPAQRSTTDPFTGSPTDRVSAGMAARLAARYDTVRGYTEELAAPLSPEDQTVQSMPDVSPTKWHRAHVTWFFETFVLASGEDGFTWFEDSYRFLFNSYYESVGPRYLRPERGLVSRPGAAEVAAYRAAVDTRMRAWLDTAAPEVLDRLAPTVELGFHHEQQHQELLLMDIKHVLSRNPMHPAYGGTPDPPCDAGPTGWVDLPGGLVEIGHTGDGFAFDNEGPRHRVWLEPFRIADRLVTNGEWLEFMADDGYRRPELWLSDGIAAVRTGGWQAPLYWLELDGRWFEHTLAGTIPVNPGLPVTHVSHYEADAFATWAGLRLPTEAEWEHAATSGAGSGGVAGAGGTAEVALSPAGSSPVAAGVNGRPQGPQVGSHRVGQPATFHPRSAGEPTGRLRQLYRHAWQWTGSAYLPYPGYRPPAGAVGEYNGKFMSNQLVLKGSSALTPRDHARASYRNFFPPSARWAMTGVRLAEDLPADAAPARPAEARTGLERS